METVSKEQAQSDVSLLFRTLQSAYGAYEYFGQEKFDAAEDAVTQWLSSQDDEIKVSVLGEKLQESLAFMLAHDAHAVIYEPAAEEIEAQVRYEYFFADGCKICEYDADHYIGGTFNLYSVQCTGDP